MAPEKFLSLFFEIEKKDGANFKYNICLNNLDK